MNRSQSARREERADGPAVEHDGEHGLAPVRDVRVYARRDGRLDGLQLRVHSALRKRALLVGLHELQRVPHREDLGYAPPRAVQKPVDRREQDERIGADELRDERGKLADRYADLLRHLPRDEIRERPGISGDAAS